MAQLIKFGTDGWRAVIADDFTFANLERVALATARYFTKHKKIRNGIVIGYDARFMSREFAEKSAEVMANAGIHVKLADSIVTTPMISLLTKLENAAGGHRDHGEPQPRQVQRLQDQGGLRRTGTSGDDREGGEGAGEGHEAEEACPPGSARFSSWWRRGRSCPSA